MSACPPDDSQNAEEAAGAQAAGAGAGGVAAAGGWGHTRASSWCTARLPRASGAAQSASIGAASPGDGSCSWPRQGSCPSASPAGDGERACCPAGPRQTWAACRRTAPCRPSRRQLGAVAVQMACLKKC